MTISASAQSVGSIIWSIFWHPDIECNLVSPWVASILSAIKPALEIGDLLNLAKIFAVRRPRVALWWMGICLLGDRVIIDRITRYLRTLAEREAFTSSSSPDTAVAAWVGSPHSFLDTNTSCTYPSEKDQVPRDDLLRRRHLFMIQQATVDLMSWKAFGQISKEDTEVGIWPWLECSYYRDYVHWVWWVRDSDGHRVQDIQRGFLRDTGRHAEGISDNVDLLFPADQEDESPEVKIEVQPSHISTLTMLMYCGCDMHYNSRLSVLAMPGVEKHSWFRDCTLR